MKKRTSRVWKLFWVLVLAPVLLMALVQTPVGKTMLASALSKALSQPAHQIWIGEIRGWIPGQVEIVDLAVADADGVWLEAKGLHGRWMIRELVDRRIRLRELGAQEVVLHRLPRSGNTRRTSNVASSDFQWLEVYLDGMTIERLALGKGVAGMELEYRVQSGGAQWLPFGRVSGDLVVDGDATGRVGFEGRNGELSITPVLEQMRNPTFGMDRLSGQGQFVVSGAGVVGVVSAKLEKGDWQGWVDLPLNYSENVLQLSRFEYTDSDYSAAGDLSLGFSKEGVDVALDASLLGFELEGAARVTTSNRRWSVTIPQVEVRGWDGISMALSGTVNSEEVALRGTLAEFDVEQFPGLGISNLAGRVNGDVLVSGSLADPQVIVGLEVAGVASPLDELPDLDFRIVGGVAQGELFGATALTNSASGYFDADFSMPCAFSLVPFVFKPAPEMLDGALTVHLDLGLFNRLSFFGNQHVEGLLVAELGYQDQAPSGFLRLERGRYEHFDWGIVSRDLELEFVAVPGGFEVAHGSASDGLGGAVNLSGGLNKEGPALAVEFVAAKVLRREEVDAQVSGTLGVFGSYVRPNLAGRLVIDRAYFLLDNMAPPPPLLLTDYDVNTPVDPAQERERHSLPFDLDVQVDMPDQIYVNASLIDSVWGGGVRVESTPQGLSITGKIEPKRGYFSFIGKKFRFTDGEVVFDGSVPAVAVLNNLTAEYSRSDVTAQLFLNGRINDPRFRLESTPSMPEDEILSHVLFNRDTSTISPYQAFQIASAARQLSGGLNGPGFMYGVRQAVGVDTLEWRDADAAGGASSVAAGKYITPSLYVEVDQPLESNGKTGMSAEYEITPHFSVETSTGPELRPGIGVNWKADY